MITDATDTEILSWLHRVLKIREEMCIIVGKCLRAIADLLPDQMGLLG